ncbi:chromosome partitioning protein, ParB family [Abditibacterium utsteinense]|uniref:Chromosome partitioning protein, ParB family n=1 Tax=Abditibacterium utsteinense TaxID=1960156 RepID=A0A2S8SSF4_9BACT|nr:ParB/RepB/Spo0J family partition protein [Abditibacterium utsteinense]PQV63744.1 chromosome partitioning protein, ParB family [Abditibacterium utsteinense]
MATKTARRGLGRGLAALIPESDFDLLNTVARGEIAPAPIAASSAIAKSEISKLAIAKNIEVGEVSLATKALETSGDIRYLPIDVIEPNPFQPRQIFSEEELESLAASVKEHGVLQPILVRPLPVSTKNEAPQFQLIAGERRWRAATRAKLAQIPAIVRDVDDKSALELAIIENVQRHDISAIESAQAYRRLAKEFGLTGEQIAGRVGKSRASVANTMRLLDLPPEAIAALRESKISEGHGRALLMSSGESARRALLRRALRDGLSVRDLERLARESNNASSAELAQEAAPKLQRPPATDMARLELTLQRALGARLKLKARRRGGQIIIDFSSPEELSHLIKRMTKAEKTDGETLN